MAQPATRQQLIDYSLRKLGAPVLEINIDDDQIDDLIDDSEIKIGWRGQRLGDHSIEPMIYFIGTKHPDFTTYPYNQGSIILDPWRYIPEQDSCEVIHIGVGKTIE